MQERGNPTLHFLDRYLGIPSVALLGHMKSKRPLPSKIENICLLKTVGIGDTVLISGVVADLRMAFPHASLTIFSGQSNFEMAHMLDGIDRVVKVPIRNLVAGLRAMRAVSIDILLDFGHWPRIDALLSLLSGASFTVGFCVQGQYRHYGYDLAVKYSSEVHEIENYRQLVRALGVETSNPPFLRTPRVGVAPVSDYAVFHLWPGGMLSRLKQWRSESWVRLIEEFASLGMEVVLTGAPSDCASNDAIIERVRPHARGIVRNAAGLSLQETAGALAHSRLVVSVNTGVMHMAAALGVPLVALHGPTSSKRWGPISDRAIVVNSPLDGCGYLNLGWEYPSNPPPCMECIRYEEVRDACRRLLEMQNSSSRQVQIGERTIRSGFEGEYA